jgi:hypothetical protein
MCSNGRDDHTRTNHLPRSASIDLAAVNVSAAHRAGELRQLFVHRSSPSSYTSQPSNPQASS